jgi:hypothetical protein
MQVFFITAMHLVIERSVEILIHAVVLEWRSCLLVTLIPLLFLFPLSDLRDLTPSEVLILGLWVIFFLGNRFFSHGHYPLRFSMVFIIMSNFSSKDHSVDFCASPWGLLLPRLNLDFIFPNAIMFTSTLTTLLIIESSLVDILSLNNRA